MPDVVDRMKEILAGIDPEKATLVLVANGDEGYEIFSRYDNAGTALVLMEAAQHSIRQADEQL